MGLSRWPTDFRVYAGSDPAVLGRWWVQNDFWVQNDGFLYLKTRRFVSKEHKSEELCIKNVWILQCSCWRLRGCRGAFYLFFIYFFDSKCDTIWVLKMTIFCANKNDAFYNQKKVAASGVCPAGVLQVILQ